MFESRAMLAVGTPAPAFERVDQRGVLLRLDDLLRRGPVVLYFYPRDFTPICTREACSFRDAYEDLDTRRVTIVGVSVDDDETHRRFAARHQLPFSLLADPDKTLSRAYDVLGSFWPTTRRVTYVIDPEGQIRGVFHHELRAAKHLSDVARCLDALGS
jgi:thioredoxin-dependent peroxiredoxin